MPVRSHSAIKEGVLTPEEFVAAGDYLVSTCPTWSWVAGEPNKAKPYLPKDKQFLVTRSVPCMRRTAAVDNAAAEAGGDKMVSGGGEEDDWVETPALQMASRPGERSGADVIEDISSGPSVAAGGGKGAAAGEPASAAGGAAAATAPDGNDDDDDVPDIDDLAIEDDDEDDEAAVVVGPPLPDGAGEGGAVLRTRTYDLMITYDKYYQVPRLWLVGYDESGVPLTTKQVFEDVTEEHARKTITADPFPHLSGVTAASIHPCQHAHVMKKLAARMEEGAAETAQGAAQGQAGSGVAGGGGAGGPGRRQLSVDAYLVLFLKFIASIVPNIEYDYTLAASL